MRVYLLPAMPTQLTVACQQPQALLATPGSQSCAATAAGKTFRSRFDSFYNSVHEHSEMCPRREAEPLVVTLL